MEKYNILILMEKDKDTGFFVQTVDSYKINTDIELIENAYLTEEEGEYFPLSKQIKKNIWKKSEKEE